MSEALEIDDIVFDPPPRPGDVDRPAVRLGDQDVPVRCLKCGWKSSVREFGFVCPLCMASNFEIGMRDSAERP